MESRAIAASVGQGGLTVEVEAADLWTAWEEVRRLSSLPAVAATGATRGYRVEDLSRVEVQARAVACADPDAASWLRRRVPAECAVAVKHEDRVGVHVHATFGVRGASGLTQRSAYARDRHEDGKVRLEAFELHATEHCNLRCEHCCNMSPYLPPETLSVQLIGDTCREMARHVRADVFKIMGGEPLLHPDITAVLGVVRASGISEQVRLFTNGLLLHRMDEAFWRALDQLTVSVYASAPVKPAHLAEIREKARAFDVVLNIKPVEAFSEVMTAERQTDPEALRRTYDACWLRHRCMVVRRGVFYTCTRAAYQEDFATALLHEAPRRPAREDGVALGGEDFGERLLAYLNRGHPLHACEHCRGSDGPAHAHVQLSRADVREGRLRRGLGK